jgi:DNA replication factor GINS
MTISFDRVRSILFDERASGTLTEIPPGLYQNVHEEIERMYRDLYESGDPLSDRSQDMIRQIESFKSYIQEIFLIRTSRIIELATARGNGDTIEREVMRMMISEERELFETVSKAVLQARTSLIDLRSRKKTLVFEEKEEAEVVEEEASSLEMTVIRLIAPVEPFMGYDGRTYALMVEDIVTLPTPNASVLSDRNIALNIRIRK